MKKIDGIELVENDVKSIAPDNFRHNALYEILHQVLKMV